MKPRTQRVLGAVLLGLLLTPAVLSSPGPEADVRSQDSLGMSAFAETVEADQRDLSTVFASQAALRDPGRVGVLLVPGLPDPLGAGEADALRERLDEGSSLWLLAETTHPHPLTRPAGIQVVPDSLLQPDTEIGQRDARFVEANVRLDDATHRVLLTAPVLLDVNASRAQTLGNTTVAFRDIDASGDVEQGDPAGRHAILAQANGSRLFVFADAGVFTNTVMQADGYENGALLTTMLSTSPEGSVVIDASRNDPARWMAPMKATLAGLLNVGTAPLPASLLGLAVLGITVVALRRAPTREDWSTHEQRVGEPIPLDEGDDTDRARHILAATLASQTDHDVPELLRLPDDELDELSRRALGLESPILSNGHSDFASILEHLETETSKP